VYAAPSVRDGRERPCPVVSHPSVMLMFTLGEELAEWSVVDLG